MSLLEPALCTVRLSDGKMDGATGRYEKRLSELAGLYADEAAFAAAHADSVSFQVIETPPTLLALFPRKPSAALCITRQLD